MGYFYWSDGNQKMLKTAKAWEARFKSPARIISFNIPRLRAESGQVTCPYAGTCADICYAGQGRMAMPAAMYARERNLKLINVSGMENVRDMLIDDVSRMISTTHVRVHDSGDWFSREYYRVWLETAEACQGITFYAYTKSIPFLDWDAHPRNFRVVQSSSGKRDAQIDLRRPHAKIFASEAERKKAGYCDGNVSDIPAILGQIKIGLVYHGNRKLTEDQAVRLRVLAAV